MRNLPVCQPIINHVSSAADLTVKTGHSTYTDTSCPIPTPAHAWHPTSRQTGRVGNRGDGPHRCDTASCAIEEEEGADRRTRPLPDSAPDRFVSHRGLGTTQGQARRDCGPDFVSGKEGRRKLSRSGNRQQTSQLRQAELGTICRRASPRDEKDLSGQLARMNSS